MWKTVRPTVDVKELTKSGTDIKQGGILGKQLDRFGFTKEDAVQVEGLFPYVEKQLEAAVDLLRQDGTQLSSNHYQERVRDIFCGQRDDRYEERTAEYVRRLMQENGSQTLAAAALENLHFFAQTHVLSHQGLRPHQAMASLVSLHRAFQVERTLLLQYWSDELEKQTAAGVAGLIDKNARIMQMRELLGRVDEQNDHIQSVSAASEEMTSSISEVAENASQVAEHAQSAAEKAEQGRNVIGRSLQEILESGGAFQRIELSFEQLQTSVSTIKNVVKLIHDIADQTNLLALNASIEAARAGEHGRGFAVVADEVRKLAESTVQSLSQVNENVESLTGISTGVSKEMHAMSEKMNRGVKEAEEVLPILDDIVSDVQRVSGSTTETAATAQEQSAAMQETAGRIEQISAISEDVRELGGETGRAVYELSRETNRFKDELFPDRTALPAAARLSLSKVDHMMWKWRIYNMLLGYEKIYSASVASHHACALGQWYFDETTQQQFGNNRTFQAMDASHADVHHRAREAAEAYQQGNVAEAEAAFAALETASEEVVRSINLLMKEMS